MNNENAEKLSGDFNPRYSRVTEYRNTWERHAQTILAAITIGLITWVGMSVTNLSTSSAKTEVITADLKADVKELKLEIRALNKDRITRTEVTQNRAECQKRMDEMESRLRVLEAK